MLKKIKKIIPEKIKIFRIILQGYKYDFIRYYTYSNSYKNVDTESKYHAILTFNYHVIEKGLTMPNTTLGFGKNKIKYLIDICNEYFDKGYNLKSIPFIHSVKVLNEYVSFHDQNNYKLEDNLRNRIVNLAEKTSINSQSNQLQMNRNSFFEFQNSSFDEFCMSRHTVRNFSKEDISLDVLNKCVKLALQTPSACNRQPNKLLIIKDKDVINKILSLQDGNRGFGHLTNTLVVFTSDISVFGGSGERNDIFLNSGMFIMSFIYALHFYGIGSCALNWSVKPELDLSLRKILNIPDSQTITLILSCGYLPNEFKVALSPKLNIDEITTIIQ